MNHTFTYKDAWLKTNNIILHSLDLSVLSFFPLPRFQLSFSEGEICRAYDI